MEKLADRGTRATRATPLPRRRAPAGHFSFLVRVRTMYSFLSVLLRIYWNHDAVWREESKARTGTKIEIRTGDAIEFGIAMVIECRVGIRIESSTRTETKNNTETELTAGTSLGLRARFFHSEDEETYVLAGKVAGKN
ncbi:hypothetical protein EVAR_94514_1 [Eumeta japonica]|uniref:Uncharacterized protein n=1 Tax=Eumeta variegata TaxID=151549 RepID=A0A4C1UW19_EUMVA|nr:hypothetical protein EVAR_94514_1 [Eumeta japonica]